MDDFKTTINQAIVCMNENKLLQAEEYLKKAMLQNVSAPETHNLFGILYECKGDKLLAAKHYRAAYALDPTYKPAAKNLSRLASWGYSFDRKYDFENEPIEEGGNGYYIEYDENQIGHIKKKQS